MAGKIREELLHYIWKLQSFDQSNLTTIDGLSLDVIQPGQHNHDAGPDFLNAKIEVDGTTWVGHIEIHIKSSDWLRHQHDRDQAYQNVILHVVKEYDSPIHRIDGTTIPTLEIGPKLSSHMISRYHQLMHHQKWIPCESHIGAVSDITIASTLDKAITQRLSDKSKELYHLLQDYNQDFYKLIYHRLAWSFGLKVNAEAFGRLAALCPYHIIQKHIDQPHQIEALYFGQSGLLPSESDDTYVNILIREYTFLRRKFGLTPMAKVEWKYARLRPANFPTIRIAQFASFIKNSGNLEELIFKRDTDSLIKSLDVTVDDYWQHHYKFDKVSESRTKNIGLNTRRNIIINAVAPLLFMFGEIRDSQVHKDRALTLLESLPSEHNSIIKKWNDLGIRSNTALTSQALLQLKKKDCDHHGCLSCPVGHKIMSS